MTTLKKIIFFIPMLTLAILLGFVIGIAFTVRHTEAPIPVVMENSLQTCNRLCTEYGAGQMECFKYCVEITKLDTVSLL